MKLEDNRYENFYKALSLLETDEERQAFFEDLCTKKELEAIVQRFQIAVMLREKKNYAQINASVGASTAIISRVVRTLENSKGGYLTALDRLINEED